jgi:guanylate kinase
MERMPYGFSVSATTRSPRPGEVDGTHYRFVDRRRFREMIERGELVEWAEYGGNLYGTPVSSIEAARASSSVVVLDIELEGARQVKRLFPDAVLVWVAPPSFDELSERLRGRGDTDAEAVERRLERAARDMRLAPAVFDHMVVNDDLERAVDEIVSVLTAAS